MYDQKVMETPSPAVSDPISFIPTPPCRQFSDASGNMGGVARPTNVPLDPLSLPLSSSPA